ncbi:hypothetical protein AB833_15130 [Chromatiales bacterium (ex Bugula neritina AB1)]|nr:hypothetical protein AB833_15130 [Chromatiales bacterium (ex Bugula neritina AB1)]
MAEITPNERLVPSLLDRLTNDNPTGGIESRHNRVEADVNLREAVLRDLEWLLNTGNIQGVVDLDTHDEIAKSVINYGLPNLSGKTISTTDLRQVQEQIRRTISAFEPRIAANSLKVTLVPGTGGMHSNSAVFQIEATLWGRHMPEALFLRTEVDLELGEVVLKEGST